MNPTRATDRAVNSPPIGLSRISSLRQKFGPASVPGCGFESVATLTISCHVEVIFGRILIREEHPIGRRVVVWNGERAFAVLGVDTEGALGPSSRSHSPVPTSDGDLDVGQRPVARA